jgi:hypothetical protein
MKRIVLTVVSSSMLVIAMPGIALASNHHHHARHHARAKHASVITLGKIAPAATTAPVTPPAPPSPPPPTAPAPTAPTSAPCTPEQIGTVVAFEKEMLTIELCNKATYTGEVTEGTEIKCRSEEEESGKVHNDEDSELTRGEGAEEEDCSTTLAVGDKVYGAELAFTSFGPIWEKIGLLE